MVHLQLTDTYTEKYEVAQGTHINRLASLLSQRNRTYLSEVPY